MSLTPAEVLRVISGEASDDLKARFLTESENSDSPLCRLLSTAEKWSQANFPSQSSDSSQDIKASKPSLPEYRVLKKAGFSGGGADRTVDVRDLIAYCRGTASPETMALIQKSLSDPASRLSAILAELEKRGP